MPEGDRIEKLARKPEVAFTAARKEQYLDYFRNHEMLGGRKYMCAEAVGVSWSTVDYHVKYDPEFAQRLEEARQAWIDETILIPALDRAAKGVLKPIIGGKNKDVIVTYERVYSDSLMLAMLKAHRPEFREREQNRNGGIGTSGGGGVMIVPMAPRNTDEWQELYGEKARGKSGQVDASK